SVRCHTGRGLEWEASGRGGDNAATLRTGQSGSGGVVCPRMRRDHFAGTHRGPAARLPGCPACPCLTPGERVFTIVNMSSRPASADLTMRARIRDAAIDRFGRSGFDASVRTIAADAGVSAASIIKHYGSKE